MVGGPHDSSDGRADTMEDREIGMLQAELIVISFDCPKVCGRLPRFVVSAYHRQSNTSFLRNWATASSTFFPPLLSLFTSRRAMKIDF